MSLALNAQTLQGKVVRVVDGDTITTLDEAKVENKIRLNRIDAPEKRQAFGEVSRKHLAVCYNRHPHDPLCGSH